MKNEVNFLELIPVRIHRNYKEVDGLIHLTFIHNRIIQRVLRWIVKKGSTSTLELDSLGSNAWKSFDGKNTVYDVIKLLLKIEEDTYASMEQRVIIFIRLLLKRKLLLFLNKEEFLTFTVNSV